MPTYTMIPSNPGGSVSLTSTVPIDDYNMIGITVTWRADHALDADEVARIKSCTGVHTEVDRNYEALAIWATST